MLAQNVFFTFCAVRVLGSVPRGMKPSCSSRFGSLLMTKRLIPLARSLRWYSWIIRTIYSQLQRGHRNNMEFSFLCILVPSSFFNLPVVHVCISLSYRLFLFLSPYGHNSASLIRPYCIRVYFSLLRNVLNSK